MHLHGFPVSSHIWRNVIVGFLYFPHLIFILSSPKEVHQKLPVTTKDFPTSIFFWNHNIIITISSQMEENIWNGIWFITFKKQKLIFHFPNHFHHPHMHYFQHHIIKDIRRDSYFQCFSSHQAQKIFLESGHQQCFP